MDGITGKTALVTGSSRGIGRAVADLLAAQGARVIYHASKMSDQLVDAAQKAGGGAMAFAADLADFSDVKRFLAELQEKELQPDILVLNASVQSYTALDNFDETEFNRIFTVNAASNCAFLQSLVPGMRKKSWGRIIFIGSINGNKPAGRLAIYGASKAALMNIACTCAKENAKYNITVNTILPGVIETDRNKTALSDEKFANMLKEDIPMHRFGTAEECAGLAVFLASEKAAYITGAEIPISGGWQL